MDMIMDYVRAFVIGGLFCVIAQVLIDKTALTPARILVSYVVAGVILGAIGCYEPLAKFAGAGTLVPITGFANAISSIAIDSKAEGFILGVGANIFKIAGPVIVYGTVSSAVFGTIYWIASLI